MFFCCVALGIACGWLWRSLGEPTCYASRAAVSVAARPVSNWDQTAREWNAILHDPEELRLVGANLRYVVKLAATRGAAIDPEASLTLALNHLAMQTHAAALLPDPPAERFGPVLSLTIGDIAANLDFQSLAAIVSDLGPPADAPEWDFSFFRTSPPRTLRAAMITRPGEDDQFFNVLYHLYRLRNNGASPASPEEAWRAAVEEVRSRLEREASVSGEGKFGPAARHEILRELAAIPVLFANGLYSAGWQREAGEGPARLWDERWNGNFNLEAERRGVAGGTLNADMRMCLYPLAFPRDTRLTRIAPLIAGTALEYLAARNGARAVEAAAPPPPTAITIPESAETVAARPEEPPPSRQQPVATNAEQDETRRANRRALEKKLADARLAHHSALRILDTAKTREGNLVLEALAARKRADTLKDSYESMVAAGPPEPVSETPVEAVKLLLERDAARERLAVLRQTRTEEHPFVRQARQQLDAIESLLAKFDLTKTDTTAASAWETRRRNLYMEWEAADCTARNFEERRRRLEGQMDKAQFDASAAEAAIYAIEAELAALAAAPVSVAAPVAQVEPVRETPAPAPAPAPQIVRTPAPEPAGPVFSSLSTIAVRRAPPSWDPLFIGGLAGLILGFVWMLARELFASRFVNASEARHIVDLPLLAALPAYSDKSFQAAAKTMHGHIAGKREGGQVFVPMPVDADLPPPVGRRGKLTPGRRPVRWLGWCLGLAALALAAAVHFLALGGIAPPPASFDGELIMPAPAAYPYADGGDENWGNQP